MFYGAGNQGFEKTPGDMPIFDCRREAVLTGLVYKKKSERMLNLLSIHPCGKKSQKYIGGNIDSVGIKALHGIERVPQCGDIGPRV